MIRSREPVAYFICLLLAAMLLAVVVTARTLDQIATHEIATAQRAARD